MLLLLLIACPAEQLGIELPAGGPKSINQEDLKRDVFLLTRPGDDAGATFARRLEQMNVDALDRGEGRVCGRKAGEKGPARVLVAPWPADVGSAVDAAVLISLAKGWDGPQPVPRETWLCVAKEGAALPEGERVPVPRLSDAAEIEAVDYVRVQRDVLKLLERLDAGGDEPAGAPPSPRQ